MSAQTRSRHVAISMTSLFVVVVAAAAAAGTV